MPSNLEQLKLFDKKFVMANLQKFSRCPKCRTTYSCIYFKQNMPGVDRNHRPFLLQCGHNLCEKCICSEYQNLVCNVCNRPVELVKLTPRKMGKQAWEQGGEARPPKPMEQPFRIRDHFDMNFYLLGRANHLLYLRNDRDNLLRNPLMSSPTEGIQQLERQSCDCHNDAVLGECHGNQCTLMSQLGSRPPQAAQRLPRLPVDPGMEHHQELCSVHCRVKDSYCPKCCVICCLWCATVNHTEHGWCSLFSENERCQQDIAPVLQIIANATKSAAGAQKAIKWSEKQLESYATQTLEDIAEFFTEIHSFVQMFEQRITEHFKQMIQRPQTKINEAQKQLQHTQSALQVMQKSLESFKDKIPRDLHVRKIIDLYKNRLNELPCHVNITKITQNPFVFQAKGDLRKDFKNYFSYAYVDPNVSIQLKLYHMPYLMDGMDVIRFVDTFVKTNPPTAHQAAVTSENSMTVPHGQCGNESPERNTVQLMKTPRERDSIDNIGRISYVKTPEHFYIQMEKGLKKIQEVSEIYMQLDSAAMRSPTFDEDHYYMVYHEDDKRYYRCVLINITPFDKYQVYLLDFGMTLMVSREKLSKMLEAFMTLPYIAIRCSLYGIQSSRGPWKNEAINLLIEITQNNHVQVLIIKKTKGIYHVDLLTTHTKAPMSVREAYLYTGYAKARVDDKSGQPKKISKLLLGKDQQLSKSDCQIGDVLMVKVTNIINPQEFHVMKCDDFSNYQKLSELLNCCYGKQSSAHRNIYLGYAKMCCAVNVDNIWYRGCIQDILEDGKIQVRLVDVGSQKIVFWRSIYELLPQFRQKEYTMLCMLTDIEPLQENNYGWPNEATKYFRQLTSNPSIHLEVCAIMKSGACKVALYTTKKDVDVNIGSVMVKAGYGMSTGEMTIITTKTISTPHNVIDRKAQKRCIYGDDVHGDTERVKSRALPMELLIKATTRETCSDEEQRKQTPMSLERSLVHVKHVVNPGEFYIQLSSLLPGIVRFHEQIQQENDKLILSPLKEMKDDWSVGDHCLVFADYNIKPTNDKQISDAPLAVVLDVECAWYRGVIMSISRKTAELPFVVFLRDVGRTVSSIGRHQLTTINKQLDQVTNAVYRCHLACVEPTGGSAANWTSTVIDFFQHCVTSFETLSATLLGKPIVERDKSLPVILWGTKTHLDDPLSPCVTKYFNINRILVGVGLVRLIEQFPGTCDVDQFVEQKLSSKETSLMEWIDKIADNSPLNTDLNNKYSVCDMSSFSLYNDHNDTNLDELPMKVTTPSTPPPDAWLKCSKTIMKTMFAAYPTYVDYDCVIYLHDADVHELLNEMRSKIMKTYGDAQIPNVNELTYDVGQACIVKYHLDKLYYRGLVRKLIGKENELEVEFIDYGNVETVTPNEVRPFAPFPNLPPLVSKYRLNGICPKNNESLFPTLVLDIIHKMIVGKLVSVWVSTSEYLKSRQYCAIRLGATDISEFLIEENFADSCCHLPKVNNEIVKEDTPPPADFSMISVNQPKVADYQKLFNLKPDQMQTDDVDDVSLKFDEDLARCSRLLDEKRMFNVKEYKALHEKYLLLDGDVSDDMDCYSDNGSHDAFHFMGINGAHAIDEQVSQGGVVFNSMAADMDIIELEQSFASNYWHANGSDDHLATDADKEKENINVMNKLPTKKRTVSEKSEFEKFHPNDTSSVFSHISGIGAFKCPEMPAGIRSFRCNVAQVITSTVLHIVPFLRSFAEIDVILQKRIKCLVKSSPLLTEYAPRTICLANYSKDQQWYRAIIRSYNPAAKEVDVLYVDYLNSESVPVKLLRQCPLELINIPLRTIRVRLFGVQRSAFMREKEVRKALRDAIRQSSTGFYAVVMKENTACTIVEQYLSTEFCGNSNIMEVELFNSSERKEPLCELLVRDCFYTRI